jgi:hypothetical protein
MHLSCFVTWPSRDEFRALYNDYWDRHCRGMFFMAEDGSIEEREARPATPL